jgi:hypothetical protein
VWRLRGILKDHRRAARLPGQNNRHLRDDHREAVRGDTSLRYRVALRARAFLPNFSMRITDFALRATVSSEAYTLRPLRYLFLNSFESFAV